MFHDKDTKTKIYQGFRESTEPKVLVASGMYEGVDLPYDAGRWQVLAKIPYPSLGDPVTKYLANKDPEYYAWETIKQVLQACGRICRRLDDFGETFIIDSNFRRLYTQHRELFPDYFIDSVRGLS